MIRLMRLLVVGKSYIAIEIRTKQHQIPEEHWLKSRILLTAALLFLRHFLNAIRRYGTQR